MMFVDPLLGLELAKTLVMAFFKKKAVIFETVLEEGDEEIATENVDEDDKPAVLEQMHETFEEKKARASTASGTKGKSKPKKALPVKKDVDIDPELTVEVVDGWGMVPAGAKLTKDTTFDKRWKGEYTPNKALGETYIVSQAFGVAGDANALKHVLRGLWAWHTDATKELPPYSLD